MQGGSSRAWSKALEWAKGLLLVQGNKCRATPCAVNPQAEHHTSKPMRVKAVGRPDPNRSQLMGDTIKPAVAGGY